MSEKYIDVEIDLEPEYEAILRGIVRGAKDEERTRIIQLLIKNLYNTSCCCDTASFGDHYLSHKQPDNLIDLILRTVDDH